ncbi:hypothetical protein LZ32DRAFT_87651 [Colletotrichum eremochloae]|nr:hypothetical protein LZ32DRAFT_87651 [Colletotrichum eremochloae]
MDGGTSPGTTRFTLKQRPRFTRASNPKVRTGCITCRNRRKKCDEGKPACAVCLKYQGYCSGYAASKTQPAAIAQNNRLIRPKLTAGRSEGAGPMPHPRCASLIFSDQLEKDLFDYWRRFMDSSLLFRCDLFSHIIPQLSWNDPAVRHATLAIGAAAFGSTTREQRILGKGDTHLAALSHYGKALRLLRSLPVSPERTLVVCLLFTAFECLRGHTAAALNHINHGFRIIEDCQHQHQHQHHHEEPGGPPISLSTNIVNSFRHFSLQTWALNGISLRETPERVPWCCRGRRARYAVQEMPAAFKTLEWAHWWWNQVRHHVEHRAPLYTNFQVKGSSPPDQPPRGYCSPESARRVRTFMHYLDAWAAAFAPLAVKAEAGRTANTAEYLKALSLRIHYLYLWTGVRSAGWTDAAETARLTPTFRDIATLSRRLLEAQAAQRRSDPGRVGGGGEVFTVEDGLTWPLACSYRVCASPCVRREIVRLFREYPRRDGLLDTHTFLVMMEWIDKAVSAGVITQEQNPTTDRIVFDNDAVVLQKQLWDPEVSEWRKKNIKFNIV